MASDLDSGAVLDLLDTERLIQKIATYISRPPRMAAGEKRLGVNLVAVFVFFFFYSVYGRLTGATITFLPTITTTTITRNYPLICMGGERVCNWRHTH